MQKRKRHAGRSELLRNLEVNEKITVIVSNDTDYSSLRSLVYQIGKEFSVHFKVKNMGNNNIEVTRTY